MCVFSSRQKLMVDKVLVCLIKVNLTALRTAAYHSISHLLVTISRKMFFATLYNPTRLYFLKTGVE